MICQNDFFVIRNRLGLRMQTPEIEVLVLASRRRIEAPAVDRLRSLLSEGIDWEVFTRLTLEHGVTVIAFSGLHRVVSDLVPPDISEASGVFQERQRDRNQFLAAELIRILDVLGQQGIAILPFKGPILSCIAYGDVATREFTDLDFLIHDEDVLPCIEVLSGMGYLSDDSLPPAQQDACRKYYGQSLLFRNDGMVVIEPHWAIAPVTFALPIDYAGMWRRATYVDCNGQDIPSLSPEDLFTVLCVHGSKHEWTRLRWICDLAEVLRAYPDRIDWDAMVQRAREQRCRRMVLIGLSLVELLTGYVLPREVAGYVKADNTIKELTEKTSRLLFAGYRPSPPFSGITAFRLRMRDRLSDRLSYVWRTIVLPREDHLRLVYLPNLLYFGYYPIKLVHDYLMLPVWLGFKKIRVKLSSDRQ